MLVCVMDSSGRWLIGDVSQTPDESCIMDNVVLFETIVAHASGGQIGTINIVRPLVLGEGSMSGVHVRAHVWFEVKVGSKFYTYISEERTKLMAAAAGIEMPNIITPGGSG